MEIVELKLEILEIKVRLPFEPIGDKPEGGRDSSVGRAVVSGDMLSAL